MKTAFIGQRVRIVGSFNFPQFIGMEGTVIGAPDLVRRADGKEWYGALVDVDGLGARFPDPIGLSASGYVMYKPSLEHLEPVLYDGSEPLPADVERIFNDDGSFNPDGHVPLTVVNSEEELYV